MKPFDYNKYLKNNPLLKESIEETLDEKITATGAKDYTFKDDKGKTRIVTAYDLEQAKAKVKGFYPKADLNTITLKKVHD